MKKQQKWSEAEDKTLLETVKRAQKRGQAFLTASSMLGRTPVACKTRYYKLKESEKTSRALFAVTTDDVKESWWKKILNAVKP